MSVDMGGSFASILMLNLRSIGQIDFNKLHEASNIRCYSLYMFPTAIDIIPPTFFKSGVWQRNKLQMKNHSNDHISVIRHMMELSKCEPAKNI